MATIIIGSYMVRYPLGGNLSWALQYLVGFKDLGHDVYVVEKSAYSNSCYDPVKQVESDDCTFGVKAVSELLSEHRLNGKWCFVDSEENYYGLSKIQVKEVFKRADLYIELGAHYSWTEESKAAAIRVYIDVDPAYTQVKLLQSRERNISLPVYDRYFTIGMNVGKAGNIIPTAYIDWEYIFNPVSTRLFQNRHLPKYSCYSTIMNWKSYDNIKLNGVTYGQKDVEFEKFISLPKQSKVPLEVAVSNIDEEKTKKLLDNGWSINSAQKVTFSFNEFCNYISSCRGEFSVCKNMYTATCSGWFSDKSGAYLASSRPVIVQETGFSGYLPTGAGLFAFNNMEEAAHAIEEVESNYDWHCKVAREIASEYLESKTVLKKFLKELGL